MKKYSALTLIGGISRQSLNKQFYSALEKLHPAHLVFDVFDISKLPFFSQDLENDPPDVVHSYKDKIRQADALLIITPEYNRSYPGVLKNALDWGSRPYGQNLWDGKPAALLGASPGAIGTFGAQHHLRQVLAYLNVPVLGQPEIYFNATNAFNEHGEFSKDSTRSLMNKFFEKFTDWIDLIDSKRSRDIHQPSQGLEDSPLAH